MTGLKSFTFALALAGLVSAAPTATQPYRVNDLVVLEGTTLRFEPINGFDDTTRKPEWQLEYLENLLDYKTQPEITERSEVIEDVDPRDVVEFNHLDKRVSTGALCFQCMVDTLKLIGGGIGTRTYVLGICNTYCVFFSVNRINQGASTYAGELGWDWQDGPQTENKATWQSTPRN